MREALHDMNWEAKRLREYTSAAEVALDAANGETAEAKAAATAALAELAGELNFIGPPLILMVPSSRSLPRHPRAIGFRSS